jgi:hypothetical protein
MGETNTPLCDPKPCLVGRQEDFDTTLDWREKNASRNAPRFSSLPSFDYSSGPQKTAEDQQRSRRENPRRHYDHVRHENEPRYSNDKSRFAGTQGYLFSWNERSGFGVRNPLYDRVKSFGLEMEDFDTHARRETLLWARPLPAQNPRTVHSRCTAFPEPKLEPNRDLLRKKTVAADEHSSTP